MQIYALKDRLQTLELKVKEDAKQIVGLMNERDREKAVVGEMQQLLREASYLIQFQHDADVAARGWTEKYREKKAAWEEGTG